MSLKDKEDIARELVVSACRLLEEGCIVSAMFLVKDAHGIMGWREKGSCTRGSSTARD